MNEIKKMGNSTILLTLTVVVAWIYKLIPGLSALSQATGGNFFGIEIIPLAMIGFFFGFKYGIIATVLYGYINFAIDGFKVYYVAAVLFDYLLAYIGFSFGALFKIKSKKQLYNILCFIIILIIGSFVRFLSTTLSGYLFFAEYAPEGMHPLLYSIVYNSSYISSTLGFSILLSVGIINPVIRIINQVSPNSLDDNY